MFSKVIRKAGKTEEVIKIINEIKKSNLKLSKRLDRIEKKIDAIEAETLTNEELHATWAKQFLKNENVEALQAVIGASSIIAGGYGVTQYTVDATLTQEEKENLAKNTKTDYVTVEHIENNQLVIEYYQKSEDINLFHKEVKIKRWYEFWKK